MAEAFIVGFDDKYLASDGEGGILLVPKEEAGFFDSYEEARDTAACFSKDGWHIETLPKPVLKY